MVTGQLAEVPQPADVVKLMPGRVKKSALLGTTLTMSLLSWNVIVPALALSEYRNSKLRDTAAVLKKLLKRSAKAGSALTRTDESFELYIVCPPYKAETKAEQYEPRFPFCTQHDASIHPIGFLRSSGFGFFLRATLRPSLSLKSLPRFLADDEAQACQSKTE